MGGFQARGDGARAGKKTKGRVKIKMEFIDNKLRRSYFYKIMVLLTPFWVKILCIGESNCHAWFCRYTTFSKRKTGIMKKAYELSTLTGTQVSHVLQMLTAIAFYR